MTCKFGFSSGIDRVHRDLLSLLSLYASGGGDERMDLLRIQ
jgi:hypothetical protein